MKKFIFFLFPLLLLSCESNYITLKTSCDGVETQIPFRGGGKIEAKVVDMALALVGCETVLVTRGSTTLYSHGVEVEFCVKEAPKLSLATQIYLSVGILAVVCGALLIVYFWIQKYLKQ